MRKKKFYPVLAAVLGLSLVPFFSADSTSAEASEDTVRIHYDREDDNYEDWGLWLFEDVAAPSDQSGPWPTGASNFSEQQVGEQGAYMDVELAEEAKNLGLVVVNTKSGDKDGNDKIFSNVDDYDDLYIREGDDTVYTNPDYLPEIKMKSAQLVNGQTIEIYFSSSEGLDEDTIREELRIMDKNEEEVPYKNIEILKDGKVIITGAFNEELAPYQATFKEKSVSANVSWRYIDEKYGYDDDLGLELNSDGSASLKFWSPRADRVAVKLYDKDNQDKAAGTVDMQIGDRGVWSVKLDEENTGINNLTGYYYHLEIERNGETKLALDPYAKSMAAWNSDASDTIGKAAIVNPSDIGPELNYADIEGYEKREDAIIYEVHVRDFTSDPSIEDELSSQFGTFEAFIEKLDYIEDLGVTHIQLLPVMSYYFADETASAERMLTYDSQDNNYNWGYDPQSYFSPTGMYSENPDDPELRIQELKHLIDEIHKRDMGVILDVVYNHTADVNIFEDLVPNYYHFMDADGSPRTSFGGGRLGTTHEMSRKVLVDSIKYWVDEFKVDGFRFDMMGDHDAKSIQTAYDEAVKLNPNTLMIGEGWRTFAGDETSSGVQPADQDWMIDTDSVSVFSDEFRNELKSGFGIEGQPRFITGGARNIQQIFDNMKAQPYNFEASDPGDVVTYIAAHDNLTLHDVIAQSIKKDPDKHAEEIHKRIRLGNSMVLTSQGTAFLHAGQEFGRTKQFRAETKEAPYKSTYMEDEEGNPFNFPYFIHDSYDSSDAINKIDWQKASNAKKYPIHTITREYTTGLIKLRRSTNAFRLGTMEEVNSNVTRLEVPEIKENDLVLAYKAESTDNTGNYFVFVNADNKARTLTMNDYNLAPGKVVVDDDEAGVNKVNDPTGFSKNEKEIKIDPLTTIVVKCEDRGKGNNPCEKPNKK
ncbi:pullulanase [Halobacillus sp. Marseille-Q1614]|uniref:pullulanase n=1 Tax=Halobacillus sp. Marseille-Q1614 TaxID=2709134 RepID=UPI0020C3BD71|nr:pullulanase [Halobacillus sp. Marseille-Q1614]